MVVASPSFEKVKLIIERSAFGVGQLGDVFEGNYHVPLHDDFFPQGYGAFLWNFTAESQGRRLNFYQHWSFHPNDLELGY